MFRSLFPPARSSFDRRHHVHLELVALDDRTVPSVTSAAALGVPNNGLAGTSAQGPAALTHTPTTGVFTNPGVTQGVGSNIQVNNANSSPSTVTNGSSTGADT